MDTVATLAQLLAALVAYGRFRVGAKTGDVAVAAGFALLGAGNLALSVVPQVVAAQEFPKMSAGPVVLGLLACSTLAIAAAIPSRHEAKPGTVLRGVCGGMVLAAAVTAAVVLGAPSIDFPGIGPEGSAAGAPWAVAAHALSAVLCVVAMATALRAAGKDAWWGWLACVFALMGAARVAYAVTPADAATSLTVGDVLRLAAYSALFALCAAEVVRMWQRLAGLAVLDERRRIARELHDGLAQELGFIVSQAASALTPETARLIRSAAERARVESRRAVTALTRPLDETFDDVLETVAQVLAPCLDARVHLDLAAPVRCPGDVREASARIVAEALRNADRHGAATTVTITSRLVSGRLEVTVEDDGRGFDIAHCPGSNDGHFGLEMMRERAAALTGRCSVATSPGGGTTVRLRVPYRA